jgi:hypothetical protein
MAWTLGHIEGLTTDTVQIDNYVLDEDDLLLISLLQDPIYCAELLWTDPTNHEYGECYRVRDYQYPLWRHSEFDTASKNYAGFACGRSVGKTESIKGKAFCHAFRRNGEDLLLTAPELIHLLPLTDAIESRIQATRLTREFLDTRNGKTGFTHRPFGVDYLDNTKIIGRIPRLTGVGVKGMHEPDMIIDEAQDYPEKGWVEAHEAQPLDAQVLTPGGFVRMGDLATGDLVVGVNGRPTKVLDVLDHGERETLRLHFSDGATVECDEDHWWTVTCNRHPGKWRVIRAKEIEEALARGRGFGSLKQPWFVPHNEAVTFAHRQSLPVDPYLLGAALGDGCFRKGAFELAVGDTEILDHFGARLSPEEELVPAGGRSYRLRRTGARSRWKRPPLRDGLEALGLWGKASHEKWIPPEYLLASKRARLELLRGLVDTDGNVDAQGAVRFCTSSERLADDAEFLVRSLGGRLRRSRQEDRRGYRTMHVLRFRIPGSVPCRLSRKVERVRHVKGDSIRRSIVKVERVGAKPMRCIEVEAKDGLYLTDGFIATHNTVMKDHVDFNGEPDFTYEFYGVHSGDRSGGFHARINEGGFRIVQVTAIQRPGWSAAEKKAAKAAYGGTSSSDYRRNILGEPGSAASALFVTSRLMACVDQDRESDYNLLGYAFQELRAEEVDESGAEIRDLLDLPSSYGDIYCGMDVGLTSSPTVIMIFSHEKVKGVERLKLVRRIHLERFRTRQIREAIYAIGGHFGSSLKAFGIDVTGIGFPMFQELEDDEHVSPHLRDAYRGYFFNSKVPVGVEPEHIVRGQHGQLRDQLGNAVVEELDPMTGETRYRIMMPMIEASSRYLREFVDSGFLLLPFDTDITKDMQMETQQRVRNTGLKQKKPNAFHILDAMRGAAMGFKAEAVESELAFAEAEETFDYAYDAGDGFDAVLDYDFSL